MISKLRRVRLDLLELAECAADRVVNNDLGDGKPIDDPCQSLLERSRIGDVAGHGDRLRHLGGKRIETGTVTREHRDTITALLRTAGPAPSRCRGQRP